ncbi:cbb3-type cytochrome oxidase assembly protein CcoS [Thalassotalea eurytherma]|uniref:Cytochrome oxidase maturation protein Cbb3 n=1 Tax=Thalassotalea eurytherma TaxID=1144278 RepID=A0ABQ6H2B6_9GAMM|nr:cbb3-type cytochrome oxidase assembly protein CcoS [Thalassotalea eurytherma]GLX82305.1 cytochrome oxidase maturation protein Cbb3 [Thalassotalea eurytherma]
MTVIYVLIPIAVLLTIIGIYLFFWAVKSEQFEDLEKEGMSILYDEENKTDTVKQEEKPKDEDKTQTNEL